MRNPFTLQAITHRFHLRVAEWHLAIAMLVAGLVLLSEGDTFDLEPYVILRTIAEEATWGAALLGVGGLRMVILTINGALPRGSPHLRAILAGISAAIWSVLLAGYLSSDVPSLMIAVTGAAVVTEFVNIFRAAGSARVEDTIHGGRANGSSG